MEINGLQMAIHVGLLEKSKSLMLICKILTFLMLSVLIIYILVYYVNVQKRYVGVLVAIFYKDIPKYQTWTFVIIYTDLQEEIS